MSTAPSTLARYRAKRDFSRTPEPSGDVTPAGDRLSFVVQRHAARRLHYDFRLEWHGVLKSWAVTRGPSMDPADKRLAVEVEDHPLDYASFEGSIPKPSYGGGTVQVWDRGEWAPLDPDHVDEDLAKGELKFTLTGERLKGRFVLIRMRPRRGETERHHNWLLIKERDEAATPGAGDAVLKATTSVLSGRTMAEIAADTDPPDPAAPPKATPKRRKQAATNEPTATTPMPTFVEPQLCELVDTPPTGEAWVHELKLDGYRLQLRVEDGRATLRTRTGLDWTARFTAIADAAAALPDCLIDGEAVALNAKGNPDFSTLQATLAGEQDAPIIYYAFDLLHDGTHDLRQRPLRARKQRLRAIMPKDDAVLRYLEDFPGPGQAVLASACELAMEGIVSKRGDAPYRSGRGGGWTKAKCRGLDEFLVGGWTLEKQGSGLGALLVGAYRDGELRYLGRVGTGFSAARRDELTRRLEKLRTRVSPFVGRQPARTSDVIWARPELVVEVAYGGWTEAEGLLRHASFQGVREDKPATEVTPPDPVPPPPDPEAPPPPRAKATPAKATPAMPLQVTHPERELWPATRQTPAVSKGDLAAYYARYADRLLQQVGGRPLSVLRAPDGITGQLFFQRHGMRGQSPLIGAVTIAGQAKPYLRIDDAAGLLALAQIAVVELHPWGARAETPDTPDRLVFDFDPAEGLGFDAVIAAALELHERLRVLGLDSFARVTGGKGLHVVVPVAAARRSPSLGWPEAKQFAHEVCLAMQRDAPDRYTTTMAKQARTGKIFLDYLRNDRFATAIAAWSPRGRPGAPIARPVAWSEVKPGLDPAGCHLSELLAAPLPADPWADFATAAGDPRAAMRRLSKTAA